MIYRKLGRSPLRVSGLCLGTVNFGWVSDESESHAMLREAVDLGFNFIDTSDSYNWRQAENSSEHIIGRWLGGNPGLRRELVLASKVYSRVGEGPNRRGLSAKHIRTACEDSLRRLQTDHLDLYQMHHVDRDASWGEVWQAMELLVAQGKVIYVGSSNFAGWHIATACCAANRRQSLGLISEQSVYNLSERTVELEVIPACVEYGLGLLPYSPLAGGLLAGASADPGAVRRREARGDAGESVLRKVAQYEKLCGELNLPPSKVALAWLLAQPAVTAPIVGPRTVEQLRELCRTVEIKLEEDVLKRLDEIWPGPGGPAPEAYAW